MTNNRHVSCPMDALLQLLSGPWTTYLIWVLRNKSPIRFGELKREVPGISSRVLTQRLRMLEDAGIVYRDHKPTIPPEVSYGLTERGLELRVVLDDLAEIAQRWGIVNEEAAVKKKAPAPQPGTEASATLDAAK